MGINEQRMKSTEHQNHLLLDNQRMKQTIDSLNSDLKMLQLELNRQKDDKQRFNLEQTQRAASETQALQARIYQLESQLRELLAKEDRYLLQLKQTSNESLENKELKAQLMAL